MTSVLRNVGGYIAQGGEYVSTRVSNGVEAISKINPRNTAHDIAVGAFNPLHKRPSSQEAARAARLSYIYQDLKEKRDSSLYPSQRAILDSNMQKAKVAREKLKEDHKQRDFLHAGRNIGTPLTIAATAVSLVPGGAVVAVPLAAAAAVVPWASHAATIGREAARTNQPRVCGRVTNAVKDLFKAVASSFGLPVAVNAVRDLI